MIANSPVVAGIDFSAASPVVLAHAAKIAAAGGRRLLAVHVLDDSRIKAWSESTGRETPANRSQEEARERLEDLVANQKAGELPIEIQVPVGRAFAKLAEIVKENQASMLVLNAHDSQLKRLGSVASRCVRVVPADVMILRDWQGSLFNKVLACVDFSDTSALALDRAIDVAAAHQATLEIVHVLFPPSRDPWGRVIEQSMDSEGDYEQTVRTRVQKRLEDFLKPYAGRLAKVRFNTLLLASEDPASAISAHVVAEKIDLTVLGTQGRTWLGGLILGSTAERLLNESPTSVLLVRLPE